MNNQRLFGEMPSFVFNGAATGPALPELGSATIQLVADTTFTTLTFRWAHPSSSDSLAGLVIPAGTVLYGVASYVVDSGAGVAYHSSL